MINTIHCSFERLLPPRWIKTTWTFGDRVFENCLDKLKYNNKQERIGSMTGDEVLYYDANDERQNEKKLFETLENMSQPFLVREIKLQIREKKDVMKRVEELEKLIAQANGILKGNTGQVDAKEVEKEKKIISEQFDEAFRISQSPSE